MPFEPPNGMYPARVDEKGRVKLPAAFQDFLNSLPEKKLLATSLDRRIGSIYPIAVWRRNKEFFARYKDDPKRLKRVVFNAQDLGADTEMDSQGRVLLSVDLRRELGIEHQTVRVFFHNQRIEIYSEAMYQHMKQDATGTSADDVDRLEGAGLE